MSRTARPNKKAAAGCLIPFGLIFLAAGMAICWFSWVRILSQVAKVRAWTETPCRVTRWDIEVKPGGEVYQTTPLVTYEYEFNGSTLTGQTYDASLSSTPSINDFEAQGAAARAGGAVCFVNPAVPQESSYLQGSYTIGGFVLGMGVLFAGIGGLITLGGIFGLFRRLAGQDAAAGGVARGFAGGLLAPIFFAIFAGAGFAVWKLTLHHQPDWKAIGARMVEVPAKVIASGVATHRSSGKNSTTSYKAKVAFSYDYDGRLWHSGWLDFDRATTSSSNRGKAEEAANRYPAGSAARAWVDPAAPWQAVLEKQGGTRWWLWLFPIIFGGIGIIGLASWLFKLTTLGAALLGTKRSNGL